MTLALPQISRGYLISPLPLTIMHLEQMCQSNRAKWSNRGGFCVWTGGGWKHRCPVCEWPIKQRPGPGGRKLLLTGRHQEKRTSQSTHTFNTHTHTEWWIKSIRYQVLPRGRGPTCGTHTADKTLIRHDTHIWIWISKDSCVCSVRDKGAKHPR